MLNHQQWSQANSLIHVQRTGPLCNKLKCSLWPLVNLTGAMKPGTGPIVWDPPCGCPRAALKKRQFWIISQNILFLKTAVISTHGPLTEEQAAEEVNYDVGHTSQKSLSHDPDRSEGFRTIVTMWLMLSQLRQKELMLWDISDDDWRCEKKERDEQYEEVKISVAFQKKNWFETFCFKRTNLTRPLVDVSPMLLDSLDYYSVCHSELAQLSVISE